MPPVKSAAKKNASKAPAVPVPVGAPPVASAPAAAPAPSGDLPTVRHPEKSKPAHLWNQHWLLSYLPKPDGYVDVCRYWHGMFLDSVLMTAEDARAHYRATLAGGTVKALDPIA